MMKEELGMTLEENSPARIGFVTYASFILIGFIPLLIYVWAYLFPLKQDLFLISSLLTAFCFIIIGTLKSYITQTSILRGIIETLLLGIIAALVAYYVGYWLEGLISR